MPTASLSLKNPRSYEERPILSGKVVETMKSEIARRWWGRVLGVLLVLQLAGCLQATVAIAPEYGAAPTEVIGVLPFRNLASVPGAAESVQEIFLAEYRAHYPSSQLRLLATTTLDSLLGEALPLAPPEPWEWTPERLSRISDSLGLKYLLAGSVTEFRYKRGLGEEPVVGLSVKLVQAKPQVVLWEGIVSGAAGSNFWNEGSLSRYASLASRELLTSIGSR